MVDVILHIVLITVGILGIACFLLPMPLGIVNIGNLAGLAASICLAAMGIWLKPFLALIQKLWRWKLGKSSLLVVGSILAAGLLLCLVLSVLMTVSANRKPEQQPAAIIVLGCKVNGTQPSLMLKERLEAACAYLQEHPDVLVVVSGGQGPNEGISEAACMAQYLIEHGIDERRIYQEDQSTSTSENLRFSKTMLVENGISGDIMLGTDAFHQYRAQYLAKQEGLTCYAVSAQTPCYLVPTYWVREWFGIVHAWVFGN